MTTFTQRSVAFALLLSATIAAAVEVKPADHDATFIPPDAALESERIATKDNMKRRKPRTEDHPLYNFVYEDFVLHGLVMVSILSDEKLDYELWNRLFLINVDTKKVYKIRASHCVVSHCVYIGKAPAGQYFIDRLHASSIKHNFISTTLSEQTLPIRNSLSQFTVSPCTITDLGILGVYGIAHEGGATSTGLFVESDTNHHRNLFERLYGIDSCIDTVDSNPWGNKEQHNEIRRQSEYNLPRFIDFTRATLSSDHRIFAPTALGHIIEIDRNFNTTIHDTGSQYTTFSIAEDGTEYIAGGEAGLIFVADKKTLKWKQIQLFDYDEAVIEIFPHRGKRYFMTVSDKRLVKVYEQQHSGDEPKLLDETRTVFADHNMSATRSMRPFTTDEGMVSLRVHNTNRNNTRDLDIKKIDSHIFMGYDKEGGTYFDLETKQWNRLRALKVDWTDIIKESGDNGMTQRYHYIGKESNFTIRLSKNKRRTITGTGILSSDVRLSDFNLRNKKDILCDPFSNIAALPNEGHIIFCARYEVDREEKIISKSAPALYKLNVSEKTLAPEPFKKTEGVPYLRNARLFVIDDTVYLVDRVYPRIYRISMDGDEWSGLDFFKKYIEDKKTDETETAI